MVKLHLNFIPISVSYDTFSFTQSFDLPNSLLSFIFVMVFYIYIHELLNANGIYPGIPAHVGDKVAQLEEEIAAILNSPAGPTDIPRLIQLIQELLKLQEKYKFVSSEEEDNLRALLGFLIGTLNKGNK